MKLQITCAEDERRCPAALCSMLDAQTGFFQDRYRDKLVITLDARTRDTYVRA